MKFFFFFGLVGYLVFPGHSGMSALIEQKHFNNFLFSLWFLGSYVFKNIRRYEGHCLVINDSVAF